MKLNYRDEVVLEFLVETDLVLPPTPIYENLRRRGERISKRTVNRRLGVLEERGFVERVLEEKGYYAATEKGRAYVAGDDVTSSDGNADTRSSDAEL